MAEEHTGGHGETAGEYIQHHLTNLQVCRVNGAWVWNSAEQPAVCKGNFWTVNVDSMALSIVLGLVFAYLFRKVAKSFTKGRPGKLQAGAEWVVTFVEDSIVGTFHGEEKQGRRAARTDDRGLGVPHEHHGPDPGRLAAARWPVRRASRS